MRAVIWGVALLCVAPLRADHPLPWEPLPLARLPADIARPPAGQLGLAVSPARDGSKVFYLVNRTSHPVRFRTQDGFPYLMQEVRTSSGAWVRSQALEIWKCYVDWIDRALPPGRFVTLPEGTHRRDFDPRAGRPATVRYAAYLQQFALASPPLTARYDPAEIECAKADWISMHTLSFERALDVVKGRVTFAHEVRECVPNVDAFQRIGEFAVLDHDPRAIAYLTSRKNEVGFFGDLARELLAEAAARHR